MAKITFVLEDGQEIVVPLADHITLGRGEDNDVVVDDGRVSKHHAELVRNADGSIQLFDSNSTAGTFVNGERVRSHTILHGDRLAFGPLTGVVDLEVTSDHLANGGTTALALPGSDTQALTIATPVKAGKVGTRKKDQESRKDLANDEFPAEHQEATARFEAEKARMQNELDAVQKNLHEWRERSAAEQLARVDSLVTEEARLTLLNSAVQEAEATHGEWLKSIQSLARQHEEQTAAVQDLTTQQDQKTAALQRLMQDEASAKDALEGLANLRDQALANLQQIRAECVLGETELKNLRQQVAEFETRSQQSREIAEVREDQLRTAEKKLDQLSQQRVQIETAIHGLAGIEAKLMQARTNCFEAEARHGSLTAAIADLEKEQQRSASTVKDLESRIATLQESLRQTTAAVQESIASRQRTEETLQHVQREFATRNAELNGETQRLEEIQARRVELDRQCLELAETGQRLSAVQSTLATALQQLADMNTSISAAEAQIVVHNATIKALGDEECAAKSRVDVLYARENELRSELTRLGSSERTHRTRFEEVRQLAAEAEKEHAARQQELSSNLESSRNELADLLSRLGPLRELKEAVDQLYTRLATLPQDSTEARDLWNEIEKEKAGLFDLITTARTQAHAGTPGAHLGSVATHAQAASPAQVPVRTRAGGALAAGTTQETTLRARLIHLRENVQREEARLEQLRLERSRHEPPPRSNLAAEAMLREQSRKLETKIRQDQERHQALLHSIEISQAEEDKRRERLRKLDLKLAELRTDIACAERQRSEPRPQAELAHVEPTKSDASIGYAAPKTAD